MLTIAHSLGVNVVAEGIESEEQQTLLASLGCNAGQGYLFSRPLAINDVLNYMASHEQASYPSS
jgi:EAL domain-containing protein (putative c-di-GMP-specific phosphodiesterase class I)